MSHPSQVKFCKYVVEKFPEMFVNKHSLDVGSLDVNGNNRWMFTDGSYTGIDIGQGPNVDVVSLGHEYFAPDNKYDVIVSTECFEHDMYYPLTLLNIVRMLKPGGIFVFTCATEGRPEHGTSRSDKSAAPLLKDEWADYYKNLTEEDIRNAVDIDNIFSEYEFIAESTVHDLYFWGIKKSS